MSEPLNNEDDFLDTGDPTATLDADPSEDEPESSAALEVARDDDSAADTPATTTPDDPATPGAVPADAEGTPAAAANQPLSIKVGGKDVSIAGIMRDGEGRIVVPKDEVENYLGMIRDGLHHRTTFRDELQQREQQTTQMRAEAQQQVASATLEAQRVETILTAYDAAVAEMLGTPDAAMRFAQNYDYEMQLLKGKIAFAQQQATMLQPEAPAPVSIAEQPQRMMQEVAQHAGALIEANYPGVFDADDYKEMAGWMQKRGRRLIVTADADYPDAGIRKGEEAVDLELIGEYVADKAAAKHRATEANRAAAVNAASPASRQSSSAAPSRSAPPAVTSRAASPSSAPAPAGPPKSKAEWEASLARLSRTMARQDDFED